MKVSGFMNGGGETATSMRMISEGSDGEDVSGSTTMACSEEATGGSDAVYNEGYSTIGVGRSPNDGESKASYTNEPARNGSRSDDAETAKDKRGSPQNKSKGIGKKVSNSIEGVLSYFKSPKDEKNEPSPSVKSMEGVYFFLNDDEGKKKIGNDRDGVVFIEYTTRLPTLPPKSSEEELSHRHEYEEMMMKYEAKERDQKLQSLKSMKAKQLEVNSNREVWKEIVSKWEEVQFGPKFHHLVFKGIPSSFRCYMWPIFIGNHLKVTKEQYLGYIECAKKCKEEGTGIDIAYLIHQDLIRTFPALAFYQVDGPNHAELKRVLESYVFYNLDMGYVQGMSYLAAVLLLYMDDYQAFCCLANLLNRDLQKAFYELDNTKLDYYLDIFDRAFHCYFPKLYLYLKSIDLQHNIFLFDWVLTIFSKSLSLDIAARVWDVYLLEGDSVIFQTALAILKIRQDEILSGSLDLENCRKLLGKAHEIEESSLFDAMSTINFKSKFPLFTTFPPPRPT